MGAALRWAEAENWLGGEPFPLADCALAVAAGPRPGKLRERALYPPPAGVMTGIEALRTPLPGGRRTQGYLLVGTLSLLLHVGAGLGLAHLLPTVDQAERGGLFDATDMLLVGIDEAAALFEGARAEPASLTAPPVTETPPDPGPAITGLPPPVPEMPVMPPVVAAPEPLQALPEPEPSPVIAAPVPSRVAPQTPETRPRPDSLPRPNRPEIGRKAGIRRPATAKTNPSVKTSPDARGRQGEGVAAASRRAEVRGGTGGSAPSAGTAAMTGLRARIVAHLTRHKSYPEQAQDRGIGGRNAVSLTISRDGRVASATLAQSSGHSLLDLATMAAVRRAQPFPAIPDGGPASITLTIGLRYDLR